MLRSWAPVFALPLATLSVGLGAGCAGGRSSEASHGAGAEPGAVQPAAAEPAPASAGAPDPELEAARRLAKEIIIVDGHVDLPYRLEEGRTPDGTLSEDPTRHTEKGDFDVPRARDGGLDAPFMSIYIPAKHQTEGGAKALADHLIDMVETMVKSAPDALTLARSPADVRSAFASGRIALPMGIENGAALEGNLANVEYFHRRGVRYITLTHSKDNDICDSSYDEAHTNGGLSPFGREVVAEMNRVGIMVDVSHVSDAAFAQAVQLSKVPVIASHSSARHFTPDFERNPSDELIALLASRGGVIMINFGSTFVSTASQKAYDARREARTKYLEERGLSPEDEAAGKEFNEAYDREHPPVLATAETVADHIDYVVKLAGIEHVGFGSDFDGVGDSMPTGLRDVSQFPNLLRVLLARGYTRDQIELIAGGNVLRVWEQVQAYAAEHGG